MNNPVVFTVHVPAVPHPCLWPNRPYHHLTKHRHKQKIKQQAHDAVTDDVLALLDAMRMADNRPIKRAGIYPYELAVEVIWPKGRRRTDLDGALSACKSLLDGIASRIGIDDRYCVELRIRQRRAGKGEASGVSVTYAVNAR